MPLETDLFEQYEIYVYREDTINVSRRKCGGWVHVHKFLGAIDEDLHKAFLDTLRNNSKALEIKSSTSRFSGFWTPLETARELLQRFELLAKVAPLLDFDRVASVEYNGVNSWEMFVTVRKDIQIRILRRQDNNWVNMSNIFDFHNLSWNSRSQATTGVMTIQREFQKKYDGKYVVQNDPTLLGGVWAPLDVARDFSNSKNVSKKLLPILAFDKDQAPSDVTSLIPLSKDEKYNAENFEWISEKDYFGYPMTFKVPELTHKPKLTDLVVAVRINIPANRKKKNKTSITVSRRISDDFVNASNLIKAACALRISELNDRSEKDPYFELSNELYFLRQLNRCKFIESVTHDKKRSLNGKWVPLSFARELLAEIHLKSLLASKFTPILYDPNIKEVEVDQDEVEILPDLPVGFPLKESEVIDLLDDQSQSAITVKEENSLKGQQNDSSTEDGQDLIKTLPRRPRTDLSSLFNLTDDEDLSCDEEDEVSLEDNGNQETEEPQQASRSVVVQRGNQTSTHKATATLDLSQMTLPEKISHVGKEMNIIMHRTMVSAIEINKLDKLLKFLEDIDNLSVKMISKTTILDSLNKIKSNYGLRQFEGRVSALKQSLVRARSRAEVARNGPRVNRRIHDGAAGPGDNNPIEDSVSQYSIRKDIRINDIDDYRNEDRGFTKQLKESRYIKDDALPSGQRPDFNPRSLPTEPKKTAQLKERARETAESKFKRQNTSSDGQLPNRNHHTETTSRDRMTTDTYINRVASEESRRESKRDPKRGSRKEQRKESKIHQRSNINKSVYDLQDFKKFKPDLDEDVLEDRSQDDEEEDGDADLKDPTKVICSCYKELNNYNDGLKHHMVHISRKLFGDSEDGTWIFDRMAIFHSERVKRKNLLLAGQDR